MEGTFLVNSFPTRISLIQEFHSRNGRLQLVIHPLDILLSVSIPLGDASLLESICRRYVIGLDESKFIVDLIILCMSEFDVILDINWLSSYHISIDCFAKIVSLLASDMTELVVATSQGNPFTESFLAYDKEVLFRDQGADLSETRVISEYQNVFRDTHGLPPVREVEFCIELQSDTSPISRAP
ncbi:uncharacterized protein LOC109842209 [Asparagus officinalis]|uniref:uncharacterized protein LOC109842209 n=1 Tax=Asparagus officinalis TaxID=4686 RepID=UPI00098DEA2F|nr:uncharacterized protein LOC109842209 [Asparagus officinalis]